MQIQPFPFQTKEEYAYQTLRKAILTCELAPGEKLVIDRLSTELALSQIPIRAAMQRLQAEGLVEIKPHSSPTVTTLSPKKVSEVFALLESLESTAFRAIAGRLSAEEIATLEALLEKMDKALVEKNAANWLGTNIAFHRKIAELSDMPLLTDFTSRVLDEWERISHFYFENVTTSRLPKAQNEHREIIELLRKGDIKGLEAIATTHNRAANQAYQTILEKEK